MQLNETLIIDLYGYWHAGSGRSAGALADALVQKSQRGLPVVGGRHLKGLLRHALAKAEAMGWFADSSLPEGPADNLETLIFGSRSQQEGRFETVPGVLFVSDGSLPEAESQWLGHESRAQERQHLYRRVSSTAMTEKGVALADSLRTIEVAVPMQLQAGLSLQLTAVENEYRDQQQAWLNRDDAWIPIRQACALIDSIGASRSRGLGEARLSLKSEIGEVPA